MSNTVLILEFLHAYMVPAVAGAVFAWASVYRWYGQQRRKLSRTGPNVSLVTIGRVSFPPNKCLTRKCKRSILT
jgi:hypothetical protein